MLIKNTSLALAAFLPASTLALEAGTLTTAAMARVTGTNNVGASLSVSVSLLFVHFLRGTSFTVRLPSPDSVAGTGHWRGLGWAENHPSAGVCAGCQGGGPWSPQD